MAHLETHTIFVSGIVTNHKGEVLFVRRLANDLYLPGYYELPSGRVRVGENFEQSLKERLKNEFSVDDDLNMSYSFSKAYVNSQGPYIRAYFTVKAPIIKLESSKSYDDSIWVNAHSAAQYPIIADFRDVIPHKVDDNMTTYTVYTDGGSRGNPGPSASAYLVIDTNGIVCLDGGEYAGVGTNNRAEYTAVLLALQALTQIASQEDNIEFNIDSLLVVNQLQGLYKVKNRDLWPIHEDILALAKQFKRVTFTHIPREQNTQADMRVNAILDAHTS